MCEPSPPKEEWTMNRIFCAVALAAPCLMLGAMPARAATGALCIKNTLNGSLKMRSTGTCRATEIQLGSFDGMTLQLSGINLQIVSGAGATDGPVNGKGNLIVGYDANTGGLARTGPTILSWATSTRTAATEV